MVVLVVYEIMEITYSHINMHVRIHAYTYTYTQTYITHKHICFCLQVQVDCALPSPCRQIESTRGFAQARSGKETPSRKRDALAFFSKRALISTKECYECTQSHTEAQTHDTQRIRKTKTEEKRVKTHTQVL